ncbi:MAG: acyl-CoA thioesterase [Deltaproteobacteria bacterium]|nr:acyl-CoA thioesterase [Deltaproteobacteria bacterium]
MSSEFPVTITIPVRFNDLDPFGHVNNVSMITYLEEARGAYCQKLFENENFDNVYDYFPFVIANISYNFERPVFYPDQVEVGIRISKIGTKSMTMDYALRSLKQNKQVGTGQTVAVMFNHQSQKSINIPDDLRQKIANLQKNSSF